MSSGNTNSNDHHDYGKNTMCIHSHDPDQWPWGPLITPLVMTASYQYNGIEKPEILYERYGNPTRRAVEKTIAALEGAEYALCFSSGMTAFCACIQLLKPGDGIVCTNQVYGGVALYLDKFGPDKGFDVTFVDAVSDPENVRSALKENTKMVWMEICGNPTLGILDIDKVAKIIESHSKDTILIVDNTFLTPYIIKPLSHGVTIVMHSMTKYMSGHGDMVMGCIATNRKDLYYTIYQHQKNLGLMASPLECFLMSRSLKTLGLRMREHCSNAMAVAQYLEAHPKIEKVLYPGLPSHPQHERAKRLLPAYGGVVSFYLNGDGKSAERFFIAVKLITRAVSLGSTESLICLPYNGSHHMLKEETLKKMQIKENLVRLSVGLEDIKDILKDLEQALEAVSSH